MQEICVFFSGGGMKNASFPVLKLIQGNQIMQSQLQGNIIPANHKPANHKKNSKKDRNILNTKPALMGIELVRFDDEDNEESSMQVPIAPFLAPWTQSEPIFA